VEQVHSAQIGNDPGQCRSHDGLVQGDEQERYHNGDQDGDFFFFYLSVPSDPLHLFVFRSGASTDRSGCESFPSAVRKASPENISPSPAAIDPSSLVPPP